MKRLGRRRASFKIHKGKINELAGLQWGSAPGARRKQPGLTCDNHIGIDTDFNKNVLFFTPTIVGIVKPAMELTRVGGGNAVCCCRPS